MSVTDQIPQAGPVVPPWLANARAAYRADLAAQGAKKSTCNDYPRRAEQFVGWCFATFGPNRQAWPIDAPARWYTVKGWTGKSQGYCNLATSALRSAMLWDRSQSPGNGFNIPDMVFPPSVAPPKRRPRSQEMKMSDGSSAGIPDAGIPGVSDTTAVPAQTTFATPVPTAQPVPSYVAPTVETAPIAGATERTLNRPRTVEKRTIRNPLGSLLPLGGKFKVYRVSDGSDGQHPGERVLFSEPTEKDLRGYNDVSVWIKDYIHNVVDPLTGARTQTVTYIVENYDDQERLIPPPRKIAIPNGGANTSGPVQSTREMNGGNAPQPNAPPPGGIVDEVLKGFVRKMDRIDTWQEEQIRTHQAVVERAATDPNGAQMQWFLSQKPAPFDVKACVEDVVQRVADIVNKARDVAPAPMPLMLPPPPAKDPFDSPLLSQLVAAATKRETPVMPPAAPDPIAQMTAMANIIRPPVDPAVTAMQAQINALINEMRDSKARNPNNDPMNFFTMMKSMDDVVERRMQRFGGNGGGSVGEAIAGAIAALPETIQALANAGAIQPRPGRPGAEQATQQQQAPAVQKPQQPQQPPQPTEGQITALRGLLDGAQKSDDATVLNSVMAFIVANSQAPEPWPKMNKELFTAIESQITTVDELGIVVQNIYTLPPFGGGSLLKEYPGAVRRAVDILAWNFPIICERLKIAPRELAGIEVNPAPAPAPATVTVPGVVQQEPTPKQETAPAPAPAGEDEEEDEDEDEASETDEKKAVG